MKHHIMQLWVFLCDAYDFSSDLEEHDRLNCANLVSFPTYRIVLENPVQEMTQKVLQIVADIMPDEAARWRAGIKTQLGHQFRKTYETIANQIEITTGAPDVKTTTVSSLLLSNPSDSALVDLATSIIICRGCWKEVFFPELVCHPCRQFWQTPDMSKRDIAYAQDVHSLIGTVPWSAGNVMCYSSMHVIVLVRAMADMCELDWRTATGENMDNCKAWFVCACKPCVEAKTKRVMDWRCVVSCPLSYVCSSTERSHDHTFVFREGSLRIS